MHAAASEPSIMQIPSPGYLVPSAFGNLELRPRADTELIGPAHRLFRRQDRRDPEDLDRRHGTVARRPHQARRPRHRTRGTRRRAADDRALPPDLPAQIAQGGRERLRPFLDERYKVVEAGHNLLAVHKSDPVVQQLQLPDMPAQSAA